MPNSNVRGFVPTGHMHGRTSFQTRLRPTLGNNAFQIYPGDVVRFVSGGIERYHDAASGGDGWVPLGVVGQVFDSNRRPYTFNQPTAGPFIPVSTEGYAAVYEDPGIIYTVNCSATAAPLHVGRFQAVRVCAPTTLAGRSGMSITLGTGVTATNGEPFKLYDFSHLDGTLDESPVSGAANQDVEVLLVNNMWTNMFRSKELGHPASATG